MLKANSAFAGRVQKSSFTLLVAKVACTSNKTFFSYPVHLVTNRRCVITSPRHTNHHRRAFLRREIFRAMTKNFRCRFCHVAQWPHRNVPCAYAEYGKMSDTSPGTNSHTQFLRDTTNIIVCNQLRRHSNWSAVATNNLFEW